MKSAKPSTGTSKRPRGEASTTASTSGDQPIAEEIPVDPIAGVDPVVNDIVAPPFSLRARMKTFMTTQTAHGQLIDELLTEVASLRADFAEYRSVFPPPPPFDP